MIGLGHANSYFTETCLIPIEIIPDFSRIPIKTSDVPTSHYFPCIKIAALSEIRLLESGSRNHLFLYIKERYIIF